jgi:hypothetical protein
LNNPNRQVVKGDAYGYNYKYAANVLMLLPSLNFRLIKLTSIWRSLFPLRIIKEMDYIKNGIYETISFGKSEKVFENFGFGILFKISGKQSLNFNGAHLSKAPTIRNTFPNSPTE